MAFKQYNYCKICKIVFVISIIILFNLHNNVSGMRILKQDQQFLILQSLPRGSSPSKGANPCTNIPGGKKKGRCMLAQNIKTLNSEKKNNNTQRQESNHS
ncbi:hypothetical protein EJD97_015770 [Solanum chilense]|uniref:Transmembrane protein n=1 Tax=Solanum chilense TaxID=4083 RepID=A0A6N2BBA7_SOLCI|nr:hypothetical protein EJD97_015770 [Solanum chilense]